jgi:hypothetical protein
LRVARIAAPLPVAGITALYGARGTENQHANMNMTNCWTSHFQTQPGRRNPWRHSCSAGPPTAATRSSTPHRNCRTHPSAFRPVNRIDRAALVVRFSPSAAAQFDGCAAGNSHFLPRTSARGR